MHSVKWSNSSIWPIDGTITCTTVLGHSGPRSDGDEGVLYISQNSKSGASTSDCFVSYPGYLFEGES